MHRINSVLAVLTCFAVGASLAPQPSVSNARFNTEQPDRRAVVKGDQPANVRIAMCQFGWPICH